MNHLTIFSILGLLLVSCHTPQVALRKAYRQLPPAERQLADSVLLTALDSEALYTLLDTLKPMSSVQFYQLPLRSAQTQERDSARETILKLQRIANTLSAGDYQFLLQPFERPDSVYRNMEIYVIRKSALQKRVSDAFAFYSKLGITPDAHPATILAVTEYENKYDRWRSYGYLFGYPEYAVDFFIQAGMQQDSTGVFVQRDFFQIPVYAAPTGHFTYAIPKGHTPAAVDSSLHAQASRTLVRYSALRQKYSKPEGVSSVRLWIKNW
jgi:hypothetical protein